MLPLIRHQSSQMTISRSSATHSTAPATGRLSRMQACIVLVLLATSGSATSRELTMLAPFPPHFVLTAEVAVEFAAMVKERSRGALRVRLYGPDVVAPFYQLEPVQAGVFDLLYGGPAYHAGDVPAAVALGGIRGGYDARREHGIWRQIDRIYQAVDLRLLALPQLGSRSAQLILTRPFDSEQLLRGLKIRSTLTYRHIVRRLGGTPVNMPNYDIFSALDRGVIDGAAYGNVGVGHLQLHEVASYLVRPAFGVTTSVILIAESSWQRLTPAERAVLLDAGAAIERRIVERFDMLSEVETRAMLKAGMMISELPDSIAAELDRWFATGMWEYALRWGGKSARDLQALAIASGMFVGDAAASRPGDD